MKIAQLEPKQREAIKIAALLMVENGLGDWRLDIKEVTSFHAQTRYKEKKITWSRRSLRVATKDQFIGIMYHEMAHAIVGGGHGHGPVFKRKVEELSGSREFAGYATQLNAKHYLTQCPVCNAVGTTNKDRLLYCRPCYSRTRKQSILVVTPNPLAEVTWS